MNMQAMQKRNGVRQGLARFLSDYVIIVPIIVLIVVFGISGPNFLTGGNAMNVLRQVSMVAILAAGQFFIICTGELDISLGSLVSLGGIIFAKGMVDWGMHPLPAALATFAVCLVCGLLNGVMVTRFRIPSFVATLGMQYIGSGLCYVLTNAYPVSNIPAEIAWIGRGYLGSVPWPVILMLAVFVLITFISQKTKFGRFVYAVGGNQEAAHLSGIPVSLIKNAVFLIGGFSSALVGIILVSRLNSGQPGGGTGMEFQTVIACVMGGVSLTGGKGKAQGVILGAIFVGILTNGMTLLDVNSYYQKVIQGVVLVLAIGVDVYKTQRQANSR